MTRSLNLYVLAHILTACLPFVIGAFVFAQDHRRYVNRIFLLYNTCIAWWGCFNLFMVLAGSAPQGLFWDRVSLMGIVLIPTTFLHFTLAYLGEHSRYKRLILTSYVSSLVFGVASWSPLMARSVSAKHFVPFFSDPGSIYPFFLLFFSVVMATALGFCWTAYRRARTTALKRTNFYFFIAALVATVGGSGNFFVSYDVFVPLLIPYGTFGIVFYTGITGHLIVRRGFLDIEVIIKRTLVFAGFVAAVAGAISIPVSIVQFFLGRAVGVSAFWLMVFGVATTALIYRPLAGWLTNLTDKSLFQKKVDYRVLLKEGTKYLAQLDSLKHQARRIVSFLLRRARMTAALVYVFEPSHDAYLLKASRPIVRRQELLRITQFHALIQRFYKDEGPLHLDELLGEEKTAKGDTALVPMIDLMKALKAESAIPCFGS